MRKTLIIVIGIVVLLAGLAGYIIGSEPISLKAPDSNSNASGDGTQNQTQNDDNEQTVPTYESLLITADVDPLPLSLQAGVYYDDATARQAADEITQMGYAASVGQYRGQENRLLYVVLLGPFANEAKLQLAQFELSTTRGIATRRIMTPPPAK